MQVDAITAMTRFGLGPRPGEWRTIAGDPRGSVLAQLDMAETALIHGQPDHATIRDHYIATETDYRAAQKAQRAGMSGTSDTLEILRKRRAVFARDLLQGEIGARYRHGVATSAPFVERLVLFWSNHFTVTATKGYVSRVMAGLFERDAIRPHVLGSFEDMLFAAVTHPAMLHYLDNTRNIGPGSRAGQRRNVERVNENLAREVLELHTLGAQGGYTQRDVIELARVLTGWVGDFTLRGERVFRHKIHEPGPKTILGVTYRDAGPEQLRAVLRDLARHPSTARFIAGQFATAFVADTVSERTIARLQETFLETGGDLRALCEVLLGADEAWDTPPAKLVPPYDFMVACGRGAGARTVPDHFVVRAGAELAHGIWRAPSPAGWPTDDSAFAGGDAMLERIDFAQVFARRFGKGGDTRELARDLFGDMLDPFVAEAVARAEDSVQGLVLLLMSPPYQRR